MLSSKREWLAFAVLKLVPLLAALSTAATLIGQDILPPTRTECLQWDNAFATLANYSFIVTLACSWIAGLGMAVFGPHSWFFARPHARLIVGALIVGVLFELGIVVAPRVGLLGRGWLSAIDPRYVECQAMSFDGPGLLWGLLSRGVAVYASWPMAAGLIAVGAVLGYLFGLVTTNVRVSSAGLEARARGDAG